MGWRDDLGNFDLGRLTLRGWLVFLLAFASGIASAILVNFYGPTSSLRRQEASEKSLVPFLASLALAFLLPFSLE